MVYVVPEKLCLNVYTRHHILPLFLFQKQICGCISYYVMCYQLKCQVLRPLVLIFYKNV
jgi:hypothetical protein